MKSNEYPCGDWLVIPARPPARTKQRILSTLTDDEHRSLEETARHGLTSARRFRRARVLLLSADGPLDARVAAAAGRCVTTVAHLRRHFVAERLDMRDERPWPGATPKLSPTA